MVASQALTKVFMMQHPQHGRVCLKQADAKGFTLLKQELDILKLLEGIDGVPTGFDALSDETHSYLIESFFKAAPLHKLFFQFPRFPIPLAAMCFRQVGEILKKIHNMEIVHRDIKLPNILLSSKGIVYVVDFGHASPAGKISGPWGTKHVRAPETYWDEPKLLAVNPFASDFWSFGVCLFEVVAGTSPFGSFDVQSCDLRDLSAIVWPSWTTGQFKDLICSLLELDPSRRMTCWDAVLAMPFFSSACSELPEEYEEEVDMQLLGF